MPAPVGNQFAKNNEGGRPPIHTDPKKVERLIKKYFKWIEGETEEFEHTYTIKDEEGSIKTITEMRERWKRHPEPPTVTGLTLFLGFSDKSSLYDYSKNEVFSHPIKKALSEIEKFHEMRTSGGDKCTGNIFILKNFGWKDKTEIEANVNTVIKPTKYIDATSNRNTGTPTSD